MKMKQFLEIPRILKKNIISTVAKKESSLKIENTKEVKTGQQKTGAEDGGGHIFYHFPLQKSW